MPLGVTPKPASLKDAVEVVGAVSFRFPAKGFGALAVGQSALRLRQAEQSRRGFQECGAHVRVHGITNPQRSGAQKHNTARMRG